MQGTGRGSRVTARKLFRPLRVIEFGRWQFIADRALVHLGRRKIFVWRFPCGNGGGRRHRIAYRRQVGVFRRHTRRPPGKWAGWLRCRPLPLGRSYRRSRGKKRRNHRNRHIQHGVWRRGIPRYIVRAGGWHGWRRRSCRVASSSGSTPGTPCIGGARNRGRQGTCGGHGHVGQQGLRLRGQQVGRCIKNFLALPAPHPAIGNAQLVSNHLELRRAGRAACDLAHLRSMVVGAPLRQSAAVQETQREPVMRIQPSSASAT